MSSRTLSRAMKDKLVIIIPAVNFVKTSAVNTRMFAKQWKDMDSNHDTLPLHTSVLWFNDGMLFRVYEMIDEMKLSLEAQMKQDQRLSFTSEWFQLAMAYLVFFEDFKKLNLLLQGKNFNRIDDDDAIHAFMAKLLWHSRFKMKTQLHFSTYNKYCPRENQMESEFKTEVEANLRLLKQEFEGYFPELCDTQLPEWTMTRNLLTKTFFQTTCGKNSWTSMTPLQNTTSKNATNWILGDLRGHLYELVWCGHTYTSAIFIHLLLWSGFSTLVKMKTKSRNKRDCEADLRCAWCATKPRIKLWIPKNCYILPIDKI